MAKAEILQRTITSVKSLLGALKGVSIEYKANTGIDAELLQAIRRYWNDTIFQQNLSASQECAAIIKEVKLQ